MAAKRPFDVKLCVLCEDIRDELHNKHSLIGVYSGDILVSEIPASISLAFYLEIEPKRVGDFDLQFRLSGPAADASAVLNARVGITNASGVSILRTPRIELGITEAGTFRFDMSLDRESWTNLVTKTISLMSGSTVSPQPSEQSPSAAPASS